MNYIFGILILIGLITVIFLLTKKKNNIDGEKLAALLERTANLANQNEELRKAVDAKLSEAYKTTQDQFGKTAGMMQGVTGQANKMMMEMHAQSQKVITEVSEKLAKLDETNKQVVNFSSQLQDLQDILKNPKQRGILGEYYLETILKNVLPPGSYEMQYKFKNGDIVDAAVFVDKKVIPIDSKFSLENYNRLIEEKNPTEKERLEKNFVNDLKLRIKETAKYIKPDEGTMDFAFMFIPHESIYYDLLINKVGAMQSEDTNSLIQRAAGEYHVVIISPTSFHAYLQTILQGLKAMKIEETAKEIRKNVEKLCGHLYSYEEHLKKMGKHLSTTVVAYNDSYSTFKMIDKDIMKITDGEPTIEVMKLDGPKNDD